MSDPTDREEPGRIRDLPERFGRYTILKRLGKGGMGAVYLARDSQLQRNVALKVPSFAAGEDREIVIRFQREAQAAARLRHPNICPVYDVSEFEGIHFLTMAYIEGHTLDAFIQPGFSLPPSHVAAVVRKIALALQKAHDAGIVHRDLKPSNIMVDQRCEPVIMDFGLARRAGPEVSQLTRSGVLLGTPAYMSPEQVMAHPDEIGFATDLYSLGVVLYQLLTGRLPFRGQAAAVIGQILTVEPSSPRVHRSDLDPELASVCLKALAKKPHDRYPSMTEFAAALEPFACQTRHTQLPDAPRSPGAEGENDPRTLIEIFEATALQSGAGPHEAGPPISNGRIRKHRWLRVTLATLAAVSLTTAVGLVLWNGKPAELAHKRSPGQGHGVQDATAAGKASSPPSPAQQVPAPVAPPLEASAARDAQRQWSSFLGLPVEMTNSLGMRFRLIPPGRFTMGAAADEIAEMERQARMEQEPTWAVQFMKDNPFPAHHVVITRPFYLGTCEVTQGEYEALMQSHPSVFREPILRGEQGDKDPAVYPVDQVSWEDSVEFCRRLSENPAEISAGRAYRLPTEAEWEYACRAGTVSRYWFGDDPLAYDQYAWCARNSQRRPHPVGLKPPNAWGLHDMLGNVWEWCQDWYDKEYYSGSPANDPAGPSSGQTRVYRGQSWYWDSPNVLGASSFRLCDRPDFRSYDIGFRVACPLGDRNETKTGWNMLSTKHTGVDADVSGR